MTGTHTNFNNTEAPVVRFFVFCTLHTCTLLMTFHMVIYRGSPAGRLRITAELWVNEAFVPAVSCHDVFEERGILVMRAHFAHTHTHAWHMPSCLTHTHEDRKIHQSSSHTEGGSLKQAVSFLPPSSINFSVALPPSSLQSPVYLSICPPGHRHAGLTFLRLSSCLWLAGRGVGPAATRLNQMVGSSLGLVTRNSGKTYLAILVTAWCGGRLELCGGN